MKIVMIILLLLVAATIVGVLVAGPKLKATFSGMSSNNEGTVVWAETTTIRGLTETVQAPGEIEPHTSVDIAAEVSARILSLPFREGDEVRKGDIICNLDDKDLKAMLVSSRARRDGEEFRLKSDQARLDGLLKNTQFAERELERQQKLYESGDASMRDLDQATERVDDLHTSTEATRFSISVAESSLEAAEADIERAEDGLANTIIEAPMDGIITQLNVEVGEIVTGSTTNPGTVMMTIADLDRMILKAEVAESDIAQIILDQQCQIHINAYDNEIFTGTVRQIALQRQISQTGTGFFRTEIEIDLQGRRIYSGLLANVDIEITTHEGIVVPYQSIVVRDLESMPADLRGHPLVDHTKQKVSVVYRIIDGKAICTPVKPGPSDLTHRLVEEGLEEGEQIVIGPYKVLESIAHDEAVQVEDPNAPKESPESSENNEDDASDEARSGVQIEVSND